MKRRRVTEEQVREFAESIANGLRAAVTYSLPEEEPWSPEPAPIPRLYADRHGDVWRDAGDGMMLFSTENESAPEARTAVEDSYGPLVELVSVDLVETWDSSRARPEPVWSRSPAAAYMGAEGQLFEVDAGGELVTLCRPVVGATNSVSYAAQMYGPLVELSAASDAPAVRDDAAELSRLLRFSGKHLACVWRSAEGPWCEWRIRTGARTLAELSAAAGEHMREAHGG